MPLSLEANRPESVIIADREEHSKKPLIVYDIIEHMYPNANYLSYLLGIREIDGIVMD